MTDEEVVMNLIVPAITTIDLARQIVGLLHELSE